MRLILLFRLAVPRLFGNYSNPIATSGGEAVFFEAQMGSQARSWYVARVERGEVRVTGAAGSLADVDDAAAVFATTQVTARSCSNSSSSACQTAPPCTGTFGLVGPGFRHGPDPAYTAHWSTFLRLSRSGKYAWIEQGWCGRTGPRPPLLNGLYEPSSLRSISAKRDGRLANQRLGRRAIADQGRALVVTNGQLEWLDKAGAHVIRNSSAALEAVTDAQGTNIVYVQESSGELHWITGPDWAAAQDLNLKVRGTAPALTDDGSALLFLDADNALRLYVRATAEVLRLGPGKYSNFSTAGGVVFAVTQDRYLVRIDLSSGDESIWLAPLPAIDSIQAPSVFIPPDACAIPCYGGPQSTKIVSRGMVVVMHGSGLSTPGWRARVADRETTLHPMSDTAAWFQIPNDTSPTAGTIEIFRPDSAIRFRFLIQVRNPAVHCLGTMHQDFGGLVSRDSPATPGEIVHVYLTGLQGVEPVPDGIPNPTDRLIPVANPLPLYDPRALEVTFFGLAPGLVGIQQLDLRIVQRPTGNLFSSSGISTTSDAFLCSAPAVATQ